MVRAEVVVLRRCAPRVPPNPSSPPATGEPKCEPCLRHKDEPSELMKPPRARQRGTLRSRQLHDQRARENKTLELSRRAMADMGQLHFFATRADLLLVLSGLEARYVVQFVRGKVPVHTNPLKLPRLGIASNESSIASTTYLMFPKGVRLRDRPDAVSFTPGGLFKKEALISGSFKNAHLEGARLTDDQLNALELSREQRKSVVPEGPGHPARTAIRAARAHGAGKRASISSTTFALSLMTRCEMKGSSLK